MPHPPRPLGQLLALVFPAFLDRLAHPFGVFPAVVLVEV